MRFLLLVNSHEQAVLLEVWNIFFTKSLVHLYQINLKVQKKNCGDKVPVEKGKHLHCLHIYYLLSFDVLYWYTMKYDNQCI